MDLLRPEDALRNRLPDTRVGSHKLIMTDGQTRANKGSTSFGKKRILGWYVIADRIFSTQRL